MSRYRDKDTLKRNDYLMEEVGVEVLLLAKPANMHYLTGERCLYVYTMVANQGRKHVFK